MGYRIGLDIGITSVGWSAIEDDANGNPIRIIDLGSRIFDVAENPKDGSALAKVRRDARGLRRRLRRKRHRVERTKRLLEKYNIITKKELQDMYTNYKFQYNVYELRVLGLDEKLTNRELSRVLISFMKKRGYKSNSKSEETNKEAGKLLTATKANEELMKDKSYRTVAEMYLKDDKFKFKDKNGEYILDSNGNKQVKIKNSTDDYKSTILRSLILDEIKQILNKQKELNNLVTDSFIEEYLNIFEGQRNFDDGPGGESPYAGNQIEKMLGNCTFEKDEKRATKATYTFEYFKLLQTLNHIKIITTSINENHERSIEKRELTCEEKEKIKNLLLSKTTVNFYDIRKELNLSNYSRFNLVTYKSSIDFSDESNKEIEKDRKLKEFESYNKIKTALNHIEKNYINRISKEDLDVIGYALTVYKNDDKRIEYIVNNSKTVTEEAIKELLPLSFSKVGNLSLKAMKKIIPELEKGLTYDKAVDNVYEDFRGSINTTKKSKLSLKDLEQSISNPVVRRGISQAIKVLNAITLKYNSIYGKPDVVIIELAREMGKNFQDRNKIKKSQEENMNKNEKALEVIKEYKSNPTGQDIVKYKLWQEQQNICIYSGKNISIQDLFTEAVDVDHIIPYSMCFDDSYNNKVLVLASENRQKGNRVPYEYEKAIGRNLEEYEIRINNIIKNPRKKRRLLREKFTREDAKDWKKRNLVDTQYITKIMYNLVKNHLEFSDSNNFTRKVWTVNGQVTSHIRKRLGIEKIREDGDIHHAIDATIIAITSQNMINKITKYYQYKDGRYMNNKGEFIDLETGEILTAKEYEEKNGIYFPEPWTNFRKELDIRVNCNSKERMLECLKAEHIYTYDTEQKENELESIFVSRMPRRKVTGPAHLKTIRGLKKENGIIKSITKTELTKLKLKNGEIEGYPEKNKQDDKLLYNALKEQLIKFGGDAQEAFKNDFYKPRTDGTKGPLVKKVKIEEKVTLGVEFNNGKSIAENGDLIRLDIFYVENEGYYFIPIYISDVVKDKLPTKACVANKSYEQWKEMKDENFIFSIYPKDLLHIVGKNKIKLNPSNKDEKSIEVDEVFAYYVKANISSAAISVQTHDDKYKKSSMGIKSLKLLEKYEVDVLGNYHKVKLPEKRLPFNIKK